MLRDVSGLPGSIEELLSNIVGIGIVEDTGSGRRRAR
jgi:hypothetical protein